MPSSVNSPKGQHDAGKSSSDSVMLLHPNDTVLVALTDLAAGLDLPRWQITLKDPVRRGHKIAKCPIEQGHNVIKYGQIIGAAAYRIEPGSHVHIHNCAMSSDRQSEGQNAADKLDRSMKGAKPEERYFDGFVRADGRVGTRNYLGVLTSVNCSASVARLIAEQAEKSDWFQNSEYIDGIVPMVHGTGCGMSAQGEGYKTLFRTLSGYAQHPNFAGILLVGLGCEVMQISDLVGDRLRSDPKSFQYMTIQAAGGTRKTIERGVDFLKEMAFEANKARRSKTSISHLSIALQCGGSDAFSGLTANPALGYASDLLVSHGGTTILAETPEIYGAEHLLIQRATSREVAEKLTARIKWWADYTRKNDATMDNNPSPGNKRGGLTTILEKSLGAIAKGGTAPLSGVYLYGEPITCKGLTFMDSPGYDPCSVTGQVASGANLVIFTTGRGSVFGYKPSPSIKLATNSQTYAHMHEDMDINCGDILDNNISIAQKGQEIFDLAIRVSSGKQTKSEQLGFGGAEFVPWQIGAVM